MSRAWKIAVAIVVVLVALLVANAFSTGNQTKEAGATVAGGQILSLSRGDLQVTDSAAGLDPAAARALARSQPIVLIHCYTCSLRWFERLEPLLARDHRVIRVDLLGHGGSEKPESGYEIPNQAAAVAEALNRLGVEGALVAGNSMGAAVTASLAEQASELVDRAVVIGMAPRTDGYGSGLPLLARLAHQPLVGPALWRLMPDAAIRSESADAFAPGFDTAAGFSDPDTPVEDVRAMTYTAFDEASDATGEYLDEIPLDRRFAAAAVPLLVIFGAEDQLFDAERALDGFAAVPGVRTELVPGAGHAPQVERPERVARLLEEFAVPAVSPSASGRRPSPTRRGDRPSRRHRGSDARRGGGREGREPRRERRRSERS